jgi:hypothetical protein
MPLNWWMLLGKLRPLTTPRPLNADLCSTDWSFAGGHVGQVVEQKLVNRKYLLTNEALG